MAPYDCLIGPPGLGEKALHRPGRDAHRFREILGVAPLLVLHQQRLKVIPAVIPPLLAAEGGRKEGVEFLKAVETRRSSPHPSPKPPNIICPAILPDLETRCDPGCSVFQRSLQFARQTGCLRGQLFRDEDFADLYCPDNGRDSVPPSLVATALLLQAYNKVSDLEAKQRADFDIRWKVALGIEVEDRPFAKSTLQLFRAQLILHDRVRAVFQRSLQFARQTGCERTADEGSGGHHLHSGPGSGQGHLQPAGRRHSPGGQGTGPTGWRPGRGVGLETRPGALLWLQCEGRGGD